MSEEWWRCPNNPPCSDAGVVHDIYEPSDPLPQCCIEGCGCGHQADKRDDLYRRMTATNDDNER